MCGADDNDAEPVVEKSGDVVNYYISVPLSQSLFSSYLSGTVRPN